MKPRCLRLVIYDLIPGVANTNRLHEEDSTDTDARARSALRRLVAPTCKADSKFSGSPESIRNALYS